MPSWKLRLLGRIQDISAEHTHILSAGYPTFDSRDGLESVPIRIWRDRLRSLASDRAEIEFYAAAVGLPASAIDEARQAGHRGVRWYDSTLTTGSLPGSKDRVHAYMVDGIATDVWQLEHMAAIAAEQRFGRAPDQASHRRELDEVDQFGRNMAALWNRANVVAHAIGLSAQERTQIWGRDTAGWQRLAGLVATYDDGELHERWRAYAWRGVEHEILRDLDRLPTYQLPDTEPGEAPPLPHLLIERAANAVAGLRSSEASGPDLLIDAAFLPHTAPIVDTENSADPHAAPGGMTGMAPGQDLGP
ncbi:hypothetical protein [Nocardia sp. NPDC047648]|uniref:hypothetical protein n=1 Tax=Nocardia sp. NPDC047648 TaxID=3155625 RepID=UPI0033F27297